MYSDLPVDQLAGYLGSQTDPAGFDGFWEETLAEAQKHPLDVVLEPAASALGTLRVWDVTFNGYGGERIRAWLRVPAEASGPLPGVVQFVGYGGGRGDVHENLFWASAGFAHLHMDTRGQGADWSRGATPDASGSAGPQGPGVMTRGVTDRHTYYYRRLYTDAVRAVEALQSLDLVDSSRCAAVGGSQGGAMALAAAALAPGLSAVAAYVPFLSDLPRAVQITDAYPYRELRDYLAVHRGQPEQVMQTLQYFDAVNFSRRARIPALFSVGLMDEVTPPSTVYAAYNNYAGPKELLVWPYNGHEGGGIEDEVAAAGFLRRVLAGNQAPVSQSAVNRAPEVFAGSPAPQD
ncbi:acetylxylan esterase [Arthrobacter sp. Sa2BUA2]|uniref:Acetylxylan esterase n=1 Tax=Arthrobacter pullicola TaxID=2762224 RepID=A0ABR8YGH1_9MICC|nr:acetylxylan esterase [Arthrobacter pullicola]MBD8043319.1 acetylxylan esterase [Arthrobacter pullicola]